MAIPAGVTLATVRFPAPPIQPDAPTTVPYIISATLTPTRRVFHRRTGVELLPVGGMVQGPGTGLALLVPHSEQRGYRNEAGNSIGSWEYDVEVKYRDVSGLPRKLRKRIFIPAGTADVDLLQAQDVTPEDERVTVPVNYTLNDDTSRVETMTEGDRWDVVTSYTYNANGSIATETEVSKFGKLGPVAYTYS